MSNQFFSVENYQAATTTTNNRSRNLDWGIEGEPYSRYNYIDLIKQLKKKDKIIVQLNKQVDGAQYAEARRNMELKALEGDPRTRRRHQQELRVGPLASENDWMHGPPRFLLSGYKPPSTIGLDIQKLFLPTAWVTRPVVVVHFDIPSQSYHVATEAATFLLVDAATHLGGERAVGKEIILTAWCDLVFVSSSSSPSLLLRYRSHEERTEDEIRRTPDVNKVVGSSCVVLHRRRRRHSKTEIFLVREINEDFDEWKNVLRTYLIKIVEFPQFAPDEERRQIRRTINDMRVQLLDSVRWNLSNWPYDKLMIVYESQGWVRKYFADYSCSIC